MKVPVLALCLAVAAAAGCNEDETAGADAALSDPADAALPDAVVDAVVPDAAPVDALPVDAEPADALPPDAAPFTGVYPSSVLIPDCAPSGNEPAIQLLLTHIDVGCLSELPDPPFVVMKLHDPAGGAFPLGPGSRLTFDKDDAGETRGGASVCPPDGGRCDSGWSGFLDFVTFEDGVGGTGTWGITYRDGTELGGEFDAGWCAPAEPLNCFGGG